MARTRQTTRISLAGFQPPEPLRKWRPPTTSNRVDVKTWRTASEVGRHENEVYLADLTQVLAACYQSQQALKAIELVHWPVVDLAPSSSSSSSTSPASPHPALQAQNGLAALVRLLILLHIDLPQFFAESFGLRMGVFSAAHRVCADMSAEQRQQRWQAIIDEYCHVDEHQDDDSGSATLLPLLDSDSIEDLRSVFGTSSQPSEQAEGSSPRQLNMSPLLSGNFFAKKRPRDLISPALPSENGQFDLCQDDEEEEEADDKESSPLVNWTLQVLQAAPPQVRLLTNKQVAQMMATNSGLHTWTSDARFQAGFLDLAYTSALRQIPFEQLWSQSVQTPSLAQLAFNCVVAHRLDIAPVLTSLPIPTLARLATFKQVEMQEPEIWSQYWRYHVRHGDRLIDPNSLRNIDTHFVSATDSQLKAVASVDEYGYGVPPVMANAPEHYIRTWFNDESMHHFARVADFSSLPDGSPIFQRAMENLVNPLRTLYDQRAHTPLPNRLRAPAYELFVQAKRRIQFVLPWNNEEFGNLGFATITLLPASARDYATFSKQAGSDPSLLPDIDFIDPDF